MKKQQAAKSKARGILSDSGTPNSSSRQNSPKVASPNPTSLLASIKKEKERAESELAKRSDKNGDHDEKQNQAYDRLSGKKRSRDHSEESDKILTLGSLDWNGCLKTLCVDSCHFLHCDLCSSFSLKADHRLGFAFHHGHHSCQSV